MQTSVTDDFSTYVAALCAGQPRPQRKFVQDMLSGLLESKSVLLSEIGRALDEPCKLIHTEKRLSRNLASDRLDEDRLLENYLDLIEPHLKCSKHRVPTIAVDTSDVQKKAGKKMPLLTLVRDGDTGRIGPGYEFVSIEAAGDNGRRLPILHRLFSMAEADVTSHDQPVRESIARVRAHVPAEAIWVFDSGFSSNAFFKFLDKQELRWVVRLKLNGQRKLLYDGELTSLYELQSDVPFRKKFRCRKFTEKAKRSWMLLVGWTRVGLPRRDSSGGLLEESTADYSLVVVHGTGHEPMLLLTNIDVRHADAAQEIADSYMERWACEEAHRFCKQAFKLENIRVLTWRALRRLTYLAMLAYGFLACLVHGDRAKAVEIAKLMKAFGPPPVFLHYRLVEGIGKLLRATFRRRSVP